MSGEETEEELAQRELLAIAATIVARRGGAALVLLELRGEACGCAWIFERPGAELAQDKLIAADLLRQLATKIEHEAHELLQRLGSMS